MRSQTASSQRRDRDVRDLDFRDHRARLPATASRRKHPTGGDQLDDLVAGARRGERWAWDALVERYRPLVRAVASGYRLNRRDVEDVDQTVWLRLVENLDRIREPRALPKWLMTTAGNESLRLTRNGQRTLSSARSTSPCRSTCRAARRARHRPAAP